MVKSRKKDRKSTMLKPSQLIFKAKVFRNSSCQIE